MSSRAAIEARRDQALADLADVERQLADGELDAETAARLAATYRREAAAAESELAELSEGSPSTRRRSPRRVLAGAVVLLGGLALAIVAVTQAVEPRPEGGFVTGGDPGAEAGVDLTEVTNEEMEQVVAENPEIVPMRLALARRYVEAGEFSDALRHYMVVLEAGPDPEALAYVGWMTHLSGDSETGAVFLERSLAERPGYELALWFLANTRLDGLDDPAGALPLVDELAGTDLPDDLDRAVEDLRVRIVAALEDR
ncbi:MAG: cytochrome C biosynthesis protein [Acidimicrobiia bacterium]|nr:cytochrome C biosynthesis protein [Acidimicrobiia bacterium]